MFGCCLIQKTRVRCQWPFGIIRTIHSPVSQEDVEHILDTNEHVPLAPIIEHLIKPMLTPKIYCYVDYAVRLFMEKTIRLLIRNMLEKVILLPD
jgi:hypothetical protein